MKRWRLVVAGSACYLLALVAMAPAALLDPLLQRASAQRLRLADAHGTLWSGRATVLLTDSAGRRPLTVLGRLHVLLDRMRLILVGVLAYTRALGTEDLV